MSLYAKFQNNSFVRRIVSSKNEKEFSFRQNHSLMIFLNFILRHGTFLHNEFHDRWPSSLRREESHRNHKSGCIKASLVPLNKLETDLNPENNNVQPFHTKRRK